MNCTNKAERYSNYKCSSLVINLPLPDLTLPNKKQSIRKSRSNKTVVVQHCDINR